MILRIELYKIILGLSFFLGAASLSNAQGATREFSVNSSGTIEISNLFGRVDVRSREEESVESEASGLVSLSATSAQPVSDAEIKVENLGGRARVEISPAAASKRIDVTVVVPPRSRLKILTGEGEVRISGSVRLAEVTTETGTIAVDVPTDEVRYQLLWTASRPRYLSDFPVEKVKEKAGGKFQLKGTYRSAAQANAQIGSGDQSRADVKGDAAPRTKAQKRAAADKSVSLNFTTDRGIVLLNVPPNEVSSDLRERPLTEAAKAIIRSGDSILMEAIRRASPKYFGDYARTLPPARREPTIYTRAEDERPRASLKRAAVRVTDRFSRAVSGLQASDFVVTENGAEREIIRVDSTSAPFNLVLLLDVSGSVDNYVNFIRKAARSFVSTVGKDDRVSIVLFNDDVKLLSKFTTDKGRLSESLDTFDAGGGTAYYDALAYTLSETLRPLKGERTAIVILTDGDDNRSFLSFDGLIGAVEESGALIYPLYVPSALIAASSAGGAEVDPLRARYITLTSRAEGEGARLASASGGVYFPITQLSQIQKAYDDIVVQLRTAYAITYKSDSSESSEGRASPRMKVKVKRDNVFTSIGPVSRVQ